MIAIIEMPRQKTDTYVQWLQSVNITPVCIPYDLPKKKLLCCLDQVQGVLWTGGAIEKNNKTQRDKYINTLLTSFEVAKQYNDKGRHYPIWGTCQGFEFLLLFQKGGHSIRSLPKHHTEGRFPITFKGKSALRTWFSDMEEEMKTNCSTHHHDYGFDIKEIPSINIVSTLNDFINIIEYKEYPFYGVQFHPERPFDTFSKKVSKRFALFLKHNI